MKEALLFYETFAIEDEKGNLILSPSNSPEFGGACEGDKMGIQLMHELASNCIAASKVLDVDADLRIRWGKMLTKLLPLEIGCHGQLQEWSEDRDDPNNHHRHTSHLYAAYPYNLVSPLDNPEYANAVNVTLKHRGDNEGGVCWAYVHRSSIYSRLLDKKYAYQHLNNLSRNRTVNFFTSAHRNIENDGVFGYTSALGEMLLQSHRGELHLLPCLPDAWPSGNTKGLTARGGFVVGMTWQDMKLKKAPVHSAKGGECTIRLSQPLLHLATQIPT